MLDVRVSFYIAIGWSALVVTLACIEYSLEPYGFGLTTQLVRSNEPVGFVANHPIFATTIRPNLSIIAALIALPIAITTVLSSLCRLLKTQTLHRASARCSAPPTAQAENEIYRETTPKSVMLLILVAYGVLWTLRVIK